MASFYASDNNVSIDTGVTFYFYIFNTDSPYTVSIYDDSSFTLLGSSDYDSIYRNFSSPGVYNIRGYLLQNGINYDLGVQTITVSKPITYIRFNSNVEFPQSYGASIQFSTYVYEIKSNDLEYNIYYPTIQLYNDQNELIAQNSGDANGNTYFTINTLPIGSGYITATFDETYNYLGSSAQIYYTIIESTSSSLTITSNVEFPQYIGSSVLVSAYVYNNNGIITSGNVSFRNNENNSILGTINVINGYANLSTSSLSLGSNSITATFTGTGYVSSNNSINYEIKVGISNITNWNTYIGNVISTDYDLLNNIIFDNNFNANLNLFGGDIFDGKNNTIFLNNLSSFNGLFNLHNGNTSSTIKNLKIVTSNISINDNKGILINGSNNGTIVSNCYIENVKLVSKNTTMGNNCGGLVGAYGRNITTRNCYVNGIINGTNSGGLIGNNCSNASIYNSYVIGTINANSGGICGNNSTIQNIQNTYCGGINPSISLSNTSIINQVNTYTFTLSKML
jgi:hypothetical protein